jgi:hypothetical protein
MILGLNLSPVLMLSHLLLSEKQTMNDGQ